MANLYVMMGGPGSGKSTWIQEHINLETDKVVSRDEIRFSLVPEEEPYFSQETLVFRKFVTQINNYLNKGYNVFADATHLTEASRNKLLKNIHADNLIIDCIWINTPIMEALNRNSHRIDTRSYVPTNQITNMFQQIAPPHFEEGFTHIYIVEPHRKIQILEEY